MAGPRELGQTTDPVALVPGSVAELADLVWKLRAYGDSLIEAGEGLRRISTGDGWSGEAVDRYASTLSWAQDQAVEAIRQYAMGEQQTTTATNEHNARVDDYNRVAHSGGTPTPVPEFHDPGAATRTAAHELLERARDQLRDAGDSAERTVSTARDRAPKEPGFWDKVGSALGDAGEWVLHGVEDVGIGVVNGLASYGNAMIHNP